MSGYRARRIAACALLAGMFWRGAVAADSDPCTQFKWDVSGELAVMKQTPQAITAAVKPGSNVPQIIVGTLYSVKLADQAAVTIAAPPAKASRGPGAEAGLVRFHVKKAGRYRVSITSGHWVDVVDGAELLPSVDFQGHVGCERPRKIVEFDLPAGHEFTLQLSGSSDVEIIMAVTAVGPLAAS